MCKLCEAGEVGRIWTQDLLTGKKNVHEAALFFKVGQSEVLEHMNTHDFKDPEVVEESPDFYIRELNKIFRLQKDWIAYCMQANTLTRQDIDILIKLSKETRETLKTLGEFEGRLNKQPQVNVNIALINQRYQALEKFIMTELCDECQVKVIDLTEHLKQIPETTSTI